MAFIYVILPIGIPLSIAGFLFWLQFQSKKHFTMRLAGMAEGLSLSADLHITIAAHMQRACSIMGRLMGGLNGKIEL